mgnify:CR=1 FL=1
MCRADTQANAAQGFDLSPTLMAHAGKDAPFIYPTTIGETSGFHFQDSRWRSEGGVRDSSGRTSFLPRSARTMTSFYIRRIR